MQSCSPIASASAAARRLRRFSCCSRARLRHPLQLLLPGAPFASASSCCFRTRLRHPLQLLLPGAPFASASSCCSRSRPLRLLLPNCIRFNCCSPIALAGFQPMPCLGPMFSNILRGVRGSVNKLKYEGRVLL